MRYTVCPPVSKLLPHSISALLICIITAGKDIGEKEDFENSEKNKELDDDKQPQLPAHRHGAKAGIIEIIYFFKPSHLSMSKINKILHNPKISDKKIKRRS